MTGSQPNLEGVLFGGLNYSAHLVEHPLHEFFGIDLGAYGDIEMKREYGPYHSVSPSDSEPFEAELDDLIRLHYLVLSRRVTTVLEFGVGKSTTVFADALTKNMHLHAKYVEAELRRSNQFELHSVENNEPWMTLVSSQLPSDLKDRCHLHFCPLKVSEFNGRLCTYYHEIPNIAPDLIYLDGPDQFSPQGSLRGLTTAHPDRMPMSADILAIEHFLTPGTLIVVDGRTANARFLRSNFQRSWSYHHSSSMDQHFFELVEPPLGIYNRRQVDYCLGDEYYERVAARTD